MTNPETGPILSSPNVPSDVALIEQAVELFRAEFDVLMQDHPDEWIAYRGATRLGLGPTKNELLAHCYAEGHPDREIFIAKIQPDMGITDASRIYESPSLAD
jgi:hypothetical protein